MAEFRNIHTRIWTDAWFCELKPDEKLLFIYLFSNPNASISGMYEMPKRNISLDTGLSLDRVSEILDALSSAKKVFYENGIVWVVNLKKYNDSGDSIKIQERVRKDLLAISDCNIKKMYCKHHQIPYPEIKIPHPSETEEKRREEKKGDEIETPPLKNNYLLFTQEIGLLTPSIADFIDLSEKELTEEWVHDAILEASSHNARTVAYIKKILDTWKKNGRKSTNPQREKPSGTIKFLPDGTQVPVEVVDA